MLMVGEGKKPSFTADSRNSPEYAAAQGHWAQLENYEGNEGIKSTSEAG